MKERTTDFVNLLFLVQIFDVFEPDVHTSFIRLGVILHFLLLAIPAFSIKEKVTILQLHKYIIAWISRKKSIKNRNKKTKSDNQIYLAITFLQLPELHN
jgi:hypothetical protein